MEQEDVNQSPENGPTQEQPQDPPPRKKNFGRTISFRPSPQNEKKFQQMLEYRTRKGYSDNPTDLLNQMIDYLYSNPYGDFPTGR